MQGPKFTSAVQLDGKVVIVTGANGGIGKATAIGLARRGAKVYLACRDTGRAESARQEIIKASSAASEKVKLLQLDLASFKSIREFVETFKTVETRLDILINNAAVMSYDRTETEDGLELQIGVGHFGHFLLTHLLLSLLKKTASSRIVNVSSLGHLGVELEKTDDWLKSEMGYTLIGTYRKVKLSNVLYTKELARRLEGSGVTAYSLHPGVVDTTLAKDFYKRWTWLKRPFEFAGKYLMKTTEAGAQTSLYCALEPNIEQHSGKYFSDCKLAETVNPLINDDEACKWLWAQSEKLTKIV